MFLFDFLIALIIGVLLSGVLFSGRRRTDGFSGLLIFFLVIFLAAWAGGLWLTPFGPMMFGIAWMPFLTIGVIVALIIGVFSPPSHRKNHSVPEGGKETATDVYERNKTVMGTFFWILAAFLAGSILIGYLV